MSLNEIKSGLKKSSSPEKSKVLQRFFKTGKGEYGEGDVFLGVSVPDQRRIARKHRDIQMDQLQELLRSKLHEHRSVALRILIEKFDEGDEATRKEIFDFYLRNIQHVNNWDLVDLSAPGIVGKYLLGKKRGVLYKLAKSDSLWERRIAVVSTHAFIRKGEFDDTLKISELLLNDGHDLIHKAVGWMLREVGKRDVEAEEKFLDKHHKTMPRTALRYAIERFSQKKKEFYMKK